jgi:transcriptional regulator with GAF, ATPase, and Fis domain
LEAEQLAEVFVELADTLVDEFDLIEFLHIVTARTSDLIEARAAGLLLADTNGRLRLMAASDERSELLELFQVQSLEGPCQDCYRDGARVVNVDLTEATGRWPRFAPRALAAGYRSVHAFPLRLRTDVIGALNLFGTELGPMDPAAVRIVQALADVATIGLMQERAIHRRDVLAEQLQSALSSRIVVEQAKGALSQIHDCNTDEAFELLRAYCRRNRLRLGDVARAVTSDPTSVAELTTRS